MEYIKLKNINEYKGESITPMKSPETIFEMYSVPIYETGHPEYLRGSEIGSSKVLVQKNDVLICKINPRINRVWVVADESQYQNIASSEWIVVRSKAYNPEFLAWYFRSVKFKNLMTSEVTGIGGSLTRAQPKAVAEYPVPVMSRQEQDNITNALNKIHGVITLRKRELEQLDELIKARFVEMFGNEKSMTAMNDICQIITDGTHQPPKFKEDGIPFIFVSNITSNRLTYDAEKFIDQDTYDELIKRTPIEVGDVLLSTVGSYGHPAVVKSDKKFLFQRHIAYLKPKREIVDSDYLHGAILSPDAQRQIEEGVKGIAQKTLNLSEIKKIRIPMPDMNRQKEFAAFVAQVDKSKFMIRGWFGLFDIALLESFYFSIIM
ncbi:MAG: restriction endonuclease subunit S [Solobacterium sp.]|nr:restriction endonuclease subunit S [Solobacterium sp.]